MARALLCLFLAVYGGCGVAAAAGLRVCLYYDGEENKEGFTVGERSAVMVRNLLGHFKEVEVSMASVARYARSGLSQCDRAIYAGTYYDAKVPEAFLADAARYRQPFMWMNYNIWKLQQKMGPRRFRDAWGFTYEKIDGELQDAVGGIPRFYDTFLYKGAAFRKVAYRDSQGEFVGHTEIIVVKNQSGQVLAEGVHSGTKARTPYALRKGDRFYVADDPMSVVDERDRYLIFADLLFDFLKLAPRSEKRNALVRLEDVHPAYDLDALYRAIEVFRARKIPFAISLIPRYVGPESAKGLDATADARFMKAIRYAIANGAAILVHGYEHHVPADLGCGSRYSGEGYEFWDACNRRPLPFDSEQYVQGRIDGAKRILDAGTLPFAGWVTPHYAASPLALRIIHGHFGRLLQRMTYFLEGRPSTAANAVDQFFPYTIVKDYYGMHVWPENLGYLPSPENGGRAELIDQMLVTARLNKVVRDAWASFFWHPTLAKTALGIKSLETLVDGIRAEGYEFVSLQALRERGE